MSLVPFARGLHSPISWYEFEPEPTVIPLTVLQNNNLLDIMFDTAHARAVELDEYLEAHNKTVGPLHGLPVSLKDQFHVKGAETTMAYVGWIGTFEGQKATGKEGNINSELVGELYELGAIPIAKASAVFATRQPSSLMMITD